MSGKGAQDAGPAQGLATEAARSPQSGADTTPPAANEGRDTTVCGDCGSEKVVYVTEDPAAEAVGYCAAHVPANVTDKMVEAQGRS